jgi:hypothetical protein
VDDYVRLAGTRGRERTLEVLEEIVAPPTPHDARVARQVETEMGVGHEQHAHITPTGAQRRGERRRAQV